MKLRKYRHPLKKTVNNYTLCFIRKSFSEIKMFQLFAELLILYPLNTQCFMIFNCRCFIKIYRSRFHSRNKWFKRINKKEVRRVLPLHYNTPILFDSHMWRHTHVTKLSWVLLYTSFYLAWAVSVRKSKDGLVQSANIDDASKNALALKHICRRITELSLL